MYCFDCVKSLYLCGFQPDYYNATPTSAGKKRLALFGFNNVSPDRDHADAIYNIYPQFTQNDLFQRRDGFDQCFSEFFPRRYEYDAILCANDFIAACLLKKIKLLDDDYAKSRFIIGI